MLRKSFEFTKTIPAGIRSTSAASFDEQRRSHSALSIGLPEVDDMELLLFGVAIVGTSAGSMLIGHAIARLVRSKPYRGITPIPLTWSLHPNANGIDPSDKQGPNQKGHR